MSEKNKSNMDSPADYGMHKPDGAEKLPTKHYSETTASAHKGKHNSIEGPCDDCPGGNGMYHK